MFRQIQIIGSILFLLLGFTHLSSPGTIYRWKDEKGTIHFTEDPAKIPQPYLDQVEKRTLPEGTLEKSGETLPPEKEEKTDRVKRYLEETEKKIEEKKRLERIVVQLEEEQSLLEERLKKIEEHEKEDFQYYQPFIDKRTGRWVPVATPYHEEKRRIKNRIESIKKELSLLQEKLSEINRSL